MKKFILIIGALSIVLNTLFGLIISDYAAFNCLWADVSLLLSAVILYFTAESRLSSGFKIGLTALFIVTGVIRCLCTALASNTLADNTLFIVAIVLLFSEIVCLSACLLIPPKN